MMRMVSFRSVCAMWVPETLAGDFRKFWPAPLMMAPGLG
jgi:hypothetical protein